MTNPPALRDSEDREAFRSRIETSFVVEAGAGTGKTTLLVDRLTALITRYSVQNIAAITFTEKAARELADRARSRLEQAALSATVYNRELLEALQNLDAATLSTIHSFAASMIREKSLEAGLDPEFSLLEPYDESRLLQEALTEALIGADASAQQALQDFLTLGGSIKDLITLVELLYERRDLKLDETRPADEPTLEARFLQLSDQTRELARQARDSAVAGDEFRALLEAAGDAAPEAFDPDSPDFWDWLAAVKGIKLNVGKQGNWSPKDLLRELKKERLPAFREELKAWLIDLRREALLNLTPWMRGALARMEKYKSDQGSLGFEDLLLKARDLLYDPAMKRHFLSRFERLMIDEFQDTDPLQVEIALRLGSGAQDFTGDAFDEPLAPGRLCIVGDPKQSIYRFRRADPDAYVRAAAKVSASGQTALIVQNFRSAPGIISFVNAFFQSAWPQLADQSIGYEPIYPAPGREESLPAPPALILDNPVSAGQKADEIRAAEAKAIVAALELAVMGEGWMVYDAARQTQRRADYRDCAILFPTMTGLDFYTESLKRRGIPFRVEGGRRFFVSPLLDDLAAVLSALDNPADRLNVIAALRSRFLGVKDEALARWMALDPSLDYRHMPPDGDPHLLQAAEILAMLHSQRRKAGADRLLEWFLNDTGGWGAVYGSPNAEAERRAVTRLLNLARNWSQERGSGLRGFRRWLDRARLKEDDSGEAVAGAPRGVSLITIHAAKGLEFPIVTLANLGSRRKHETPSHLTDRARRLLQARVGAEEREFKTAGFDELLTAEKPAEEAERLRLLYVGMTRARDHLLIPMFYPADKDGQPVENYPRLLKQFLEAPESAGLFRRVKLSTGSAPAAETAAAEIDLTPLFDELEHWRQNRAERLQAALGQLPVRIQPSRHVSEAPEETSVEAARSQVMSLGVAFHRYMERCELTADLSESLLQTVCQENGVETALLKPLVEKTLGGGLWREILSARRVMRETPVWSLEGQAVTRGAVDVAWEDAKGELHLADYKTGVPQPERHDEQIQTYARILEQATGKPVKSARVEYVKVRKFESSKVRKFESSKVCGKQLYLLAIITEYVGNI